MAWLLTVILNTLFWKKSKGKHEFGLKCAFPTTKKHAITSISLSLYLISLFASVLSRFLWFSVVSIVYSNSSRHGLYHRPHAFETNFWLTFKIPIHFWTAKRIHHLFTCENKHRFNLAVFRALSTRLQKKASDKCFPWCTLRQIHETFLQSFS